jgi:hypothetical protein
MSRRFEGMTTRKVSWLIMAFMVAASITGLTYAHWGDYVRIEGMVKMAHIKMTITSWKVLTSKEVKRYSSISQGTLSDDAHALTITADNLKPCWFVWVGLVTQNQGSLPAWVKPPEITYEDPNGIIGCFEHKYYFYGPYPEATGFGNLEVWGKVTVSEDLLSSGDVTFDTPASTPPFIANLGEKVVLWIWIHVLEDASSSAMGKAITISVHVVDDMAV